MTRQSIKLDDKDRKIISLLHDNQEISQEEIAKIVHLSQPSVAMRIKKLKESPEDLDNSEAWLKAEEWIAE